MKKLIQLSSVLLVSIVITACGGGGDTKVSDNPNGTANAGKLIIDNGRGTTNNQDTERAK